MQYSAKTKLQEARKGCPVFSNLSCAKVGTRRKRCVVPAGRLGTPPKPQTQLGSDPRGPTNAWSCEEAFWGDLWGSQEDGRMGKVNANVPISAVLSHLHPHN